MRRFVIKRDKGIIDGEYREGWRIYERIGKAYGKHPDAELCPLEFYRTKKEAEENCPNDNEKL